MLAWAPIVVLADGIGRAHERRKVRQAREPGAACRDHGTSQAAWFNPSAPQVKRARRCPA